MMPFDMELDGSGWPAAGAATDLGHRALTHSLTFIKGRQSLADPVPNTAGLVPSAPMRLAEVRLPGNFVLLEPLRTAHADELFPDAMEPELFRYLEPGAEQSRQGVRNWILRRLGEQQAGSALPFLQRDAVTKKAFGCTCMVNISAQHHRLEIGHTWLAKSHRKTPANTEAKLLLLTHAFEAMEAVRVQFKVDVRNQPAQQALERIGAVREGTMRNERILQDGFVRDAFVYSIIDRVWPEVKKRLTHLLWNRQDAEAFPAKRQPPPIPGLEATLRPPAPAFKPKPAIPTKSDVPPKPSFPPRAVAPFRPAAQPTPAPFKTVIPVRRA